MNACLRIVAVEGEQRRALQIAMNERGDPSLGNTLLDDNIQPHPIRKWRCDDPT